MSLWSDYSLLIKGNFKFDQEGPIEPGNIVSLLKWVSSLPDFKSPTMREIQFQNSKYYRATVESHHKQSNQIIIGCGRSTDYAISLCKAYAEVLERIVSYEVQNEPSFHAKLELKITRQQYSICNISKVAPMPLNSLRTTNGWAVHFNQQVAIQKAVFEAMERHILIYNYLKYGWKGFVKGKSIHWDNFSFESLSTIEGFLGIRAGMVLTKLTQLGFTLGYFCDLEERFQDSPQWFHALLESYEPAKFFENSKREEIEESLKSTNDPIEKAQLHYLLAEPTWEKQTIADGIFKENDIKELKSYLVIVDIGKKWNLDFSFYGAFVYGQDLIPLFFEDVMDQNSKIFLSKLLKRYSLSGDIPHVHPIF